MDGTDLSVWMTIIDDAEPGGGTPSLKLDPSYPNPFNLITTITFTLPAAGDITLAVVNVEGALVTTLASGPFSARTHEVEWDGTNAAGDRVASGVYFFQLSTSGETLSQKMVLVR